MKEYVREDNSSASITFTSASNVSRVYFEIYDLDTNDFIVGGQAASGASYVYKATIDKEYNEYDRNIKIQWLSVTASNGASESIQYASLVRPYVTVSRIREIANITSGTTDSELQNAERKARLYLQSHLPVKFNKEITSVSVYGNNSDVLFLPMRILEIHSIYEDDSLVYDVDSDTNDFDYEIESSDSKNRIKIIKTDSDIYDNLEYPEMVVIPQEGVFKKDRRYKIVGVFGYEYVPNRIEMATSLLVEDYLCNDWNIRNKAIQAMKTDSYDITYSKDFAGGTGNLQVDSLISPWYYEPRYMVI